MNRFLLLLFFCVLCLSNGSKTETRIETIKNDNLHVIDLDLPKNTQKINTSSIFKKVEAIILETKKEALVGPFYMFYVFENYVFIMNQFQANKDFLVFNREGKFIRKIGGLGQGPGEYTWLFDFTIDSDNRIIYLLCGLVINKYKIDDGTFIGNIKLKESVSCIQYAHGKLYSELRRDSVYLLQEINLKTGKQADKYFKRDEYDKGWLEPLFSYQEIPFKHRWAESPKFSSTFMDTIFTINPNGFMPFLAIKSKHLVNNADLDATIGKVPKDRIQTIKNKNKIFCIYNYLETKNHIFFHYTQGMTNVPILYSLTTNSYQKATLQNDLVFNDAMLPHQEFIFSDSNGIYGTYNNIVSNERFFELIKENKLATHVDKRDQLMKLADDSNPVIFYYSYD